MRFKHTAESGEALSRRAFGKRWLRIALALPFVLLALAGVQAPRPAFATITLNASVPASGGVGQPITMYLASSSCQSATYTWNFGDSNSGGSNYGNGSTVTHTYSYAGSFYWSVSAIGCIVPGGSTADQGSFSGVIQISTGGSGGCTLGTSQLFVTASPQASSSGQVITFTATSSGANLYTWEFGDGQSISTQQPFATHAYISGGTFTVSVTAVTGLSGACGTTTVSINGVGTGTGCTTGNTFGIGLTASPNPASPNTLVNFTAQSGIASSNFTWSFGDGQTITTQSGFTSHLYAYGGTFTATVTVSNGAVSGCASTLVSVTGGSGGGCTVGSSFTVTVSATPNPTAPNAPVSFNASSSAGATFYTWNFGDGQSASTQSGFTSHLYPYSGTFTATATVSNGSLSGCGSTVVSVSGVGGITGGNPTIQIAPNGPYSGSVGQLLTFNGTALDCTSGTCTQNTITNFNWSFGDGSTGNGRTVTHSYNTVGTFTVTLTAQSSTGQSNSATTTATIGGSIAAITGTGANTVSGVTANTNGPYSGSSGVAISFNGTGSTTNVGASIVSYTWSFGDGTSASGQQAQHTYNSNGTYTVALTITDSTGAVVTATTSASIGVGGISGNGGTRVVSLVTGCNNLASTWAVGTNPASVGDAVSPQSSLLSVWKLVDPSTTKYRGFFPNASAASDLTEVDRLDAIFICVNAPATLSEPSI